MAKKYQLHGAFPSKAGDSAYQVAQKNGFEGTEQEWLASLVGPAGKDGGQAKWLYPNLYTAVTDLNNSTTENSQETGPVQMSIDDVGHVTISLLESISESTKIIIEKDVTIRLNGNVLNITVGNAFIDVADSVAKCVIDGSRAVNGNLGVLSKTIGNGCVLRSAAEITEVIGGKIVSTSSTTNVITSSIEAGETRFIRTVVETSQTGSTEYARVAQIKSGAKLVVDACSIELTAPTNSAFSVSGELVIVNSTVNGNATSTTALSTDSSTIKSLTDSVVSVTDSIITATGNIETAVVIYSGGTLSVTNSTLTADNAPNAFVIWQTGPKATIDSSTITATATTGAAVGIECREGVDSDISSTTFSAVASGAQGPYAVVNWGNMHMRDSVCFADAPNEFGNGIQNHGTCVARDTDAEGVHAGVLNDGNMYIQGGIFTGWTHGGIYCCGNSTSNDVTNLNYINDAVIRCGYSGQFANELQAEGYRFAGCLYIGSSSHARVFIDGAEIGGTVTEFDYEAYPNYSKPYAIAFRSTGTPTADGGYLYERDNCLYISNSKILSNTGMLRIDKAHDDTDAGHRMYVGSGTNISSDMITNPEYAVFCDGSFRRTEAFFNTTKIKPADIIERESVDVSYALPIATSETLGGVKPATKTEDMTQSVGVDEAGGLWTVPGTGSGETGSEEVVLVNYTAVEPISVVNIPFDEKMMETINNAHMICWRLTLYGDETATDTTGEGNVEFGFWCAWGLAPLLKPTTGVPSAANKSWKVGNFNGYILRSPLFTREYIASSGGATANTSNYDLCFENKESDSITVRNVVTELPIARTDVVLRLTTSLPIGTGSRIILTAR